jgi:hypothetical protein
VKPDQQMIATAGFLKYPVRECRSLHFCCICGKDITLGQLYHDGGYGRRCHVDCADTGARARIPEPK